MKSDKPSQDRQIYCRGLVLKTIYQWGSVFKLLTEGYVSPWMPPEELAT